VLRRFFADAPDRLWLTDITEYPTRKGKLYYCAVLDAYSRSVVGWSIDSQQAASLVMSALRMAIGNRKPKGGDVVHGDHGSQFTSWVFSERVKGAGLSLSMGRVGDAFDNATIEAFWAERRLSCSTGEDGAPLGACQRDLRVPRGLPQPQAPSQRPLECLHRTNMRLSTTNDEPPNSHKLGLIKRTRSGVRLPHWR
jgi:transposase InsO family protein